MQQTTRYAYIDVLRGLAALLVVYQHTSEITLNPALQTSSVEKSIVEFFTQTIGIGEVGVCLFLMISGFVVPFSLLKYQSEPIRKFAVHRFFRLYPAYWLSLPLGVVFVYWGLGLWGSTQQINWMAVLANASMFQTFFGVGDIMGQYWTLGLELLFYMLCAALFYFKRLQSFRWALAILIAVNVLRLVCKRFEPPEAYPYHALILFQYLGFMFFGIFYRRWLLEKDRRAGIDAFVILLLTSLSFGAASDIGHYLHGEHTALRQPLTQWIAIAVFFCCTRLRQPSNRAGVFLGKISYSIYLFHPIVFYPLFFYWFKTSALHANPHAFIAVAMVLTIVLASITYRLIEAPFVAMGSRIFPSENSR